MEKYIVGKEIFDALKMVSSFIPTPIYWEDTNSTIIGANKHVLTAVGLKSLDDYVGKNLYELYPKEMADNIKFHNEKVMHEGKILSQEESIKDVSTGKIKYYTAIKAPLCDSNGKIIGIIGTSVDISDRKLMEEDLKKAKETAEAALQSMKQAQAEEQKHREEAERLTIENAKHKAELEAQAAFRRTIDKAAHDIGSPMSALITTMECLGGLEDIASVDGYNMALIAELERQNDTLYLQKNDSGLDFEVLGTDDALIQGHISWNEILAQLKKHAPLNPTDIPLFQKVCLGVLLNILFEKNLLQPAINEKRVPEEYRIQVRDAIEKIKDITEELIARYTQDSENKNEAKRLIPIATVLNQLVSEKRMGFLRKGVELKEELSPDSYFAFVNIQSTQVNRAIGNLMNNAQQAFDGKPGTVVLKLYANNESVTVSISDNGKGMPPEMLQNINNKIAFTAGKKNGHGIGLGQVQDTLARNHGKMVVESQVGIGTTFTLSFSKKIPPAWAIDKIELQPHDSVLILDDDKSIHGAWDLRLKPLIKKHPTLKIHHFSFSAELLKFLATLSEENKKNLFLLTDYELLNQQDTGVQVIEQTQIKRAILVTSHYAKTDIQNQVMALNAKLLPKQLVSFIPVMVSEAQQFDEKPVKVDAVWLDDEPLFTSVHERIFVRKNKKVPIYRTPKEFRDNITLYPKETPIFLDNNFEGLNEQGTEIAKELYEMGFAKLFLITGESLDEKDYPYLTLIKKHALTDLTDYF